MLRDPSRLYAVPARVAVILASWLFASLLSVAPTTAASLPSPFMSGALETWTGGEATRHSWAAWSGATWSPFGMLDRDGWRVRLSGGGGRYTYDTTIDRTPQSIYGTSAFADLLVGYQMGLGDMTLKVFGGATFDGHLLTPFDGANPVDGGATGAKAVAEAWINWTPSLWTQVDLAYATAHDSYSSRIRAGYRLTRSLSVGAEAGAFGNMASDNLRGGGFVRYEWLDGEISASAGVSGDIAADRNPYASLVYLKRF